MIRVVLKKPTSRRYYLAQWVDPVTGKVKTKSTRKTRKGDAEREAARLEIDLNSGKRPEAPTTWEVFCDRYKNEVVASMRKSTRTKVGSTLNAVTRLISPKFVSALSDANVISKFGAALRQERGEDKELIERASETIKGHLTNLGRALEWAKKMNMIQMVPDIVLPTGSGGMKGRPLSGEEVDRMIAAVPKVVAPEFVAGWQHLLRGLWLSSLRLSEALALHWTDDTQILMDLSGKNAMFQIQADTDKGKMFRKLPCTPDFVDFVRETPVDERRGYVFNPMTRIVRSKRPPHRSPFDHASKVITRIGQAANIRVNPDKWASAHDIRRGFGLRWSRIVDILVLQELMRHKSIETTREFYIGVLADKTADEVRRALDRHSNTFGNTHGHETDPSRSECAITPDTETNS